MQKYLGRSSAEDSSLRALYSSVMLDVAWALFEQRMLRGFLGRPVSPQALLTEIGGMQKKKN